VSLSFFLLLPSFHRFEEDRTNSFYSFAALGDARIRRRPLCYSSNSCTQARRELEPQPAFHRVRLSLSRLSLFLVHTDSSSCRRTILWNVIDSSVGLVPVTFVDSTLDALTPSWWSRQRSSPGAPLVEGRVYGKEGVLGGIYDAKEMEGLPVGVQIVAGHWQEEKAIELMKVVDKALGPRGFGPGEFTKKHGQQQERVY
jgi:hypothetical protein